MTNISGENYVSDYAFGFAAFGVTVEVETESLDQTKGLKKIIYELFRNNLSEPEKNGPRFKFEIKKSGENQVDLFKNGELIVSGEPNPGFLGYVETQIRLSVAEFAVGYVFVHSGAISWKGIGIVIPGNSFTGKTSLVQEFVASGAVYLSDEYAVFDKNGIVHPFAKPLSLRDRGGGYEQVDHIVEDLGGVCGLEPVQVGFVLHTKFEADAVWEPNVISGGTGVLKLLEHTLPIRVATQFSLEVFNKVAENAVFLENPRGEASETVSAFINYLKYSD